MDEDNKNYVNEDPYLVYAKVSQLFKNSNFELENKIIHPAVISSDSSIGEMFQLVLL